MKYSRILVAVAVMLITVLATPFLGASAKNDLDSIGKKKTESAVTEAPAKSSDVAETTPYEPSDSTKAVEGLFQGAGGLTEENMQKAKELTGPFTRVIGILIGIILAVTGTLIFFITAVDLLYIAFPPIRSILNPDYGNSASQAGSMGMGMGGFGGGFGGGFRGAGSLGSMPNPGAASGSLLRRRWVSDEAVQVLAAATGGVAQAQQPMGMGGGFGMGMGMGMNQNIQAQASTGSVIGAYFKKRLFFIILFVICTVVLTSSLLTDCGINIAELFMRLLGKGNDAISNIAN